MTIDTNIGIKNIINNYLQEAEDEKQVIASIIKVLTNKKLPLDNVKCLGVEDNTMNGIDASKTKWRAYFVNLITEEDFYIEVSMLQSGMIRSRCFTFDTNGRSVSI
jgi:hypothetical protein